MTDKALISELTWRSLEMQKDAFPDMPHYIAPHEIEHMLKVTTRSGSYKIHVMSLAVIADDIDDFASFFALMQRRHASLYVLEDKTQLHFHKRSDLKCLLELWKAARKNGAAKIGAKISADRKKYYSERAADKIKDRWFLPSTEWPTKALLKEADISLNTAKAHLGKRPIAQYNYQAKLKRKERANAKR